MRVLRPTDAREAQCLVDRLPDALLAGGATWLQLDWQAGKPRPDTLIALDRVDGLTDLEDGPDGLSLGAGLTLADLVASETVRDRAPLLHRAALSIGAPAIREAGTLGGNIQRGNGDTLPALFCLGARLRFVGGEVEPLSLPPRPKALLTDILLPGPSPDIVRFEKVAARAAFAVSKLTVAVALWHDGSGDGRIARARLAVGAADVPTHLLPDAANLIVAAGTPAAVDPERFREAIRREFRPGPTVPDADWRREMAIRLLAGHLGIGRAIPGSAGSVGRA